MQFTIKMHTLSNVVQGLAAHAAGSKVNRPNLHAVQFERFTDGTIRLATTDTRTLAIADIHVDYVTDTHGQDNAGVGERANVNVHDLVKVLKVLRGKNDEWVTIRTADGNMLIDGREQSASIALALDHFPKYREVLPATGEFNAAVNDLIVNPDTLAKLARVTPTNKDSKAHFRLRFKGDNQPMLFTRTDYDVSWTIYQMPIFKDAK